MKVLAISGILLLASVCVNIYQQSLITEKDEEIGSLNTRIETCKASNKNLSSAVDIQNNKADVFKKVLDSRNRKLNEIEKQNEILQREVSKKVFAISQVTHETCEQSMDWMLKEALNEKMDTIDFTD